MMLLGFGDYENCCTTDTGTLAGCDTNALPCLLPDGTLWPVGTPSYSQPANQPTVVPPSAVPAGTNVESQNPFCSQGIWDPTKGGCVVCPNNQTWNAQKGVCVAATAFGPITWPMLAWAGLILGSIGLGAFAAHHVRK